MITGLGIYMYILYTVCLFVCLFVSFFVCLFVCLFLCLLCFLKKQQCQTKSGLYMLFTDVYRLFWVEFAVANLLSIDLPTANTRSLW